jgi:hypothetical protein
LFRDKSVLKIAQNSKIYVKEYRLDARDTRSAAAIELSRGKVRAVVARMRNPSDFVLFTPNAKGVVKGSDITAFFQAGSSGMFVSEGKLLVTSLARPDKSVTVSAGNACMIPVNEAPRGPRPYLEVEKKMNDEDTYIPVSISKSGKVSVIKGVIAKVSGTVYVTLKSASQARKASLSDILGEGDSIETGKDGYAEIRLDNNNAINLKPNTKLAVVKLVINLETGEFENIFEVTFGKIKARIENLKGNSRFEVKTPMAVCGARGTIMYVDVSQNATTAFFEGGNGYMVNTLSGNAHDIPPGTGSTSDSYGNVSNPAPMTENSRQSFSEGWDPAAGTDGYSNPDSGSGTGADILTSGNTEPATAEMAVSAGAGNDTNDRNGAAADVPYTVANPDSETSSSSATTTEKVSFSGYFGHVVSQPSQPEKVGVQNDTSSSVTGWLGFVLPASPDWTKNAVYESDNDWGVATDISTFSIEHSSPNGYKIWTSPKGSAPNDEVRVTTSDNGAIRAWMGGRIALDGSATYIAGKIMGIYVDPNGTGGLFYSYFDGTADSSGDYSDTGNTDEVYYNRKTWASDRPHVSASELFNATIENNDEMNGKGNGSFTDSSGNASGTVTCSGLAGRSLGLDGQGWGVWRLQFMGTYSGWWSGYYGWNAMIAGDSPNSNGGNPGYWFAKAHACRNCQTLPWQSGILAAEVKGYYFTVDTNGGVSKIKAGIIEEGDMLGGYTETDSVNHAGNWEAVAGGGWVDVTSLLEPSVVGWGSDLSVLQNFINCPITEVHSNVMSNITSGSTTNFITAQMSPTFYTSATSPTVTSIWASQISGTYTGAVGSSWTLNLSNNPGDTVTLTGDKWSDGKWHASVTGASGSGTPGVNISYTGDAGGTYDEANKNFFGVGGGTWNDNNQVIKQ